MPDDASPAERTGCSRAKRRSQHLINAPVYLPTDLIGVSLGGVAIRDVITPDGPIRRLYNEKNERIVRSRWTEQVKSHQWAKYSRAEAFSHPSPSMTYRQ